ncbi:MAG: hypothetical protein J3R72DRAFT_497495 [Linnemannia gamsii]|nr:MAG: hypothetical protein J3R72DRAFT_497495 [Linnemannia gamsii]
MSSYRICWPAFGETFRTDQSFFGDISGREVPVDPNKQPILTLVQNQSPPHKTGIRALLTCSRSSHRSIGTLKELEYVTLEAAALNMHGQLAVETARKQRSFPDMLSLKDPETGCPRLHASFLTGLHNLGSFRGSFSTNLGRFQEDNERTKRTVVSAANALG